ncbi:neuronal acetylcholine receptor subunit alpha-10-like [Lytechinus pictus]|uniref:neuronal acetylcholine receptor subunit alpha-10-like n=1 Tax=Lytechinus pictus TaxID=7653 RepID=UPI00240DCC58|nr:neuronal acetylcholine receptor subunit alpha-10-like isoform X1 [Lytechinus pictus]
MKDYDPQVRPVKNASTVVNVQFILFFNQVLDMDERVQMLTSATWLTIIWEDEYLMWDPEDYGGVKKIKVQSDRLWLPDIFYYNSALVQHQPFLKGTIIKVKYNGEIMWAAPVNFKGHCKINVRYFPFDKQSCEMKFGPWQHDGTELELQGQGDTSVFISNGEWDMKGLTWVNNVEYYPDDPGVPYTDVTFTVYFQRRSQFYVFNLLIPASIITLMASMAFLLPPTSQGKVTLGVTFLLSKTVFLMIVAESMPPTNEVPILGEYFAVLMFLVSISLVLNVIVVSVYNCGNCGDPLPHWVRVVALHVLAPIVRVKVEPKRFPPTRAARHASGRPSAGHRVKAKLREKAYEKVPLKDRSMNLMNNHSQEYTVGDQYSMHNGGSMEKENSHGGMYAGHFQKIAGELRRMNDILVTITTEALSVDKKASTKEKAIQKEWLLIAKVLDRVFLSLYLLGNGMGITYLLVTIHQTSTILEDIQNAQESNVEAHYNGG